MRCHKVNEQFFSYYDGSSIMSIATYYDRLFIALISAVEPASTSGSIGFKTRNVNLLHRQVNAYNQRLTCAIHPPYSRSIGDHIPVNGQKRRLIVRMAG